MRLFFRWKYQTRLIESDIASPISWLVRLLASAVVNFHKLREQFFWKSWAPFSPLLKFGEIWWNFAGHHLPRAIIFKNFSAWWDFAHLGKISSSWSTLKFFQTSHNVHTWCMYIQYIKILRKTRCCCVCCCCCCFTLLLLLFFVVVFFFCFKSKKSNKAKRATWTEYN